MKSALSAIRRRLDAMPLWGVLVADAALLALWFADLRALDPLPYVDEIFVGAVVAGTSVYLWRRLFGPPSRLAAETRSRLSEIETLFAETRGAAGAITGADGVSREIARMQSLLDQVRAIQVRIENTELVLQTPQYSEGTAAAEVTRLEASLAAAPPAARANLEGALVEARKHVENIARIRATRDELTAAFERIFQLARRIHSQVLGIGLAQGSESELAGSVDELAKTLGEYETERRRIAESEQQVERELEEARRQARESQRTT